MVVETILNTRPTAREKVWAGVVDFIAVLDAVPGWSEWRKRKITYTLDFDVSLETGKRGDLLNEFSFSNEIERQHAVVMGFLTLADGVASLKECEFYFRRYPFNNLPVSRQRHMINICEMYFGRFYEIRERIRNVLDAVNTLIYPAKLDIGKFLKTFDRIFDSEIRARHAINHRERFDEVGLNRLFLAETLLRDRKNSTLERAHLNEHRRLVREWTNRVRRRGKLMDEFFEAVASAIVENCSFLASTDNSRS